MTKSLVNSGSSKLANIKPARQEFKAYSPEWWGQIAEAYVKIFGETAAKGDRFTCFVGNQQATLDFHGRQELPKPVKCTAKLSLPPSTGFGGMDDSNALEGPNVAIALPHIK